jgi:eukaryotic-like serine/threonine-protein kinase
LARSPETEQSRPTARSDSGRASSVRLGGIPESSQQDLRFVQDRIALFARTTALVSSMFLVMTALADGSGNEPRYSAIGRASHAVGTALAIAIWLVVRRRQSLSPAFLHAVDLVGTVCVSWAFAGLGHYALQPYGSYISILAITHVTFARAMIVPSVPRRTLYLAAASFAAIVVSRLTVELPPEVVFAGGSRSRIVFEGVLWSIAGVVVSTVASTVIYGLSEKAFEARVLGQYTLEERIGAGGMGEVYRARHAMLRRPTAVKLLSGEGSEEKLRRFEKEVQLTARLTHPNTISIYDYGRTPDGTFYYAMELLEGLSLEQLVRVHGPQPASRVIHILEQVCGALAEAHGIGLVHRDVKPANLHLSVRGDIPDVVKVLDFGLVREERGEVDVGGSNVNTIVGTPLYLSPEAITGPEKMDGRADIYGLGGVAYFLLTGKPPFEGSNIVELCANHLHTVPKPPSVHLEVPKDLEQVVLACLAKRPGDRPQTARELKARLEGCADAAGWSDDEARAWWQEASLPPPPMAAAEGESSVQRTFVAADLEQRI